MTLGTRHFQGLDLGDARRSARLPRLVDTMHEHVAGTLPNKLCEPRDLRAFYRLLAAPEVTHERMLVGHRAVTREAIAETVASNADVLILHDATELDYTSKFSLRDQLGQIGRGTHRGDWAHNSLAVRADTGETLGLTSQILHHRADVSPRETVRQRRERPNRESRLWVRGAARSDWPRHGPGRVVDVSDSLSDTFEYMAYECGTGRCFALRARENRKLHEPTNRQSFLYDAIRNEQPVSQWSLKVSAKAGQAARTARVSLSFAEVVLTPPAKRAGEYPMEPLRLWAVRVWEAEPPSGSEGLEWILLTNVPVTSSEEARERVGWYEKRFVIEEDHKGMKTGCGIEELQLTTIDRLEPAIAVLSVLATTLLRLRDAARSPEADHRPAREVVSRLSIEVLKRHYHKRLSGEISVSEYYLHVARLGGHQNRKRDGFPGWLTLWRGWMKLESMIQGYRLNQRKRPKTCGKT